MLADAISLGQSGPRSSVNEESGPRSSVNEEILHRDTSDTI